MRAFDVLSSHMPLVGQYSFASAITGQSLQPRADALLAAGPGGTHRRARSLALTMAAINVGSVLGSVILARRRGGVWLMLACAIGIAVMCRSLAANNFYDIWNPSAGLFPLLLLMFLSWSLACGESPLPPALLVASFVVQTHLVYAAPIAALLTVGCGGLLLRKLSHRSRARARSGPGRWRGSPSPPAAGRRRRSIRSSTRRATWR